MKILAIDPGPEKSAFVHWDGKVIVSKGILKNGFLRGQMQCNENIEILVIEQIKSYGMAVADSIFDTVFWTGRFCEAWSGLMFYRVPRMDVKMHLCHDSRARDSNIRTALIDRFGKPGTKKEPNLTYGETGEKEDKMKADMWQAFALAVYWYDTHV